MAWFNKLAFKVIQVNCIWRKLVNSFDSRPSVRPEASAARRAVRRGAKPFFPVESAADLMSRLAGSSPFLTTSGVRVDLRTIIEQIPAHYFPITSIENFAAKSNQLYTENEHRIGVPARIAPVLKRLAGQLKYPVRDVDQLHEAFRRLGISTISDGRRSFAVHEALARVPRSLFPIRSASEGYAAARRMMKGF